MLNDHAAIIEELLAHGLAESFGTALEYTLKMLGRPVLVMLSMPDTPPDATPLVLLDSRYVRIVEFGIPTVRHLTEKYALENKEAFLATSYLDAVFERPETITLLKTS